MLKLLFYFYTNITTIVISPLDEAAKCDVQLAFDTSMKKVGVKSARDWTESKETDNIPTT